VKRPILSSVFDAGLILSSVLALLLFAPQFFAPQLSALQKSDAAATNAGHLGFDRNEYPGDDNLHALRHTFEFAGYWLNNPPGANSNSWVGKRKVVQSAGFGFLVIFNGRTYAQIKAAGDATKLGRTDAAKAVGSAHREGFPAGTIIFIDQEQGGRLLPEQRAYLHAWADAVESAGFGIGVYCSGIAAKESPTVQVITAEDIQQNAGARKLTYWVTDDSCPPAPGCTFPKKALAPESSGIHFAEIWQFAQSPKRAGFAGACSGYNKDGNCYSPGIDSAQHLHLDLNVATSSDPSHGRAPSN
jgi:Domain of unknown function (DUF1906)